MLFFLLTRVLLWLLIGILLYFLLLRLLPKAYYTWLGGLVIAAVLILAFLNPNTSLVSPAWSILSFPLKPLGLAITLLIAALSPGVKKVRGNLVLSATLILIITSLPILAFWLTQQAELEAIRTEEQLLQICQAPCPAGVVPASRQSAPVIVLLGQGTTEPALPFRTRIQLTDTGDRIVFTSQLYWQERSRGINPVVIVSAGYRPELEGVVDETKDVALVLQSLGVPQSAIRLETSGTDLRSSALGVERLMRRQGLGDRLILVTSALNARRAKLSFSNVGLKVILRPTDFVTFQSRARPRKILRVEDFIPSAEGLLMTTRVIEEYFATIYYFLRGWLSPVVL